MKCPKCLSKWVQVSVDVDYGCQCQECVDGRQGHYAECLDCGWESDAVETFAEALATLEGDGG